MHKSLLALLATSLISGIYWSLIYPIYQPFILSLGASMTLLGLIEAISGRMGLLSTVAQLIGGAASDAYGRKRIIVLSSGLIVAGLTLYLLSSLKHELFYLIIGSILIGASCMSIPARNALIAELSKPEVRGYIYSLILFAAVLPSAVFSPIGGWIAEKLGFQIIFSIAVPMEAACLFTLALLIAESRSSDMGRMDLKDILRGIIPPRGLMRKLYMIIAVDTFSWSTGSILLYGFISETYGFTETQLGILSSAFSTSWAISQIPAGKFIDRFGAKKSLIISEALGILAVLMWMLSKDFNTYLISHIIFGITPPLWVPALNTYIAGKVGRKDLGKAMGGISAFRGLISFPAPYIGGMLFDNYGIQAPLIINALGAFIALLGLIRLED